MKTERELLDEIRQEIPMWDDNRSQSRIQYSFARLLVLLSEQAAKDTRSIVRLTWALFFLTLLLAFVAAVQLYIMSAQLYR